MSDALIRTSLIRLAHANPDLRRHLLPLVTDRVAEKHGPGSVWKTEGGNWRAKNEKGEAKSFGDNQDAAKAHAGKGVKKPGRKPGKSNAVFSKKHGVHLRGITDEALDAFYASPAGKEIKGYNLEVIAGEDGVVDAKSIERAVKVRDKYLAVERAKKKPKSERTKADDDALDVCQSTPACEGNLGVARSSMPQFLQMSPKAAIAGVPDKRYKELLDGEKAGKGLPDDISNDEREAYYNRKNAEAAVAAGADPNSDVSVFDDWVKNLRKGGKWYGKNGEGEVQRPVRQPGRREGLRVRQVGQVRIGSVVRLSNRRGTPTGDRNHVRRRPTWPPHPAGPQPPRPAPPHPPHSG